MDLPLARARSPIRFAFLSCAWVLALAANAGAQETPTPREAPTNGASPEAAAATEETVAANAAASNADTWLTLAGRIERLIAGELEPSVDPDALLRADADAVRALLESPPPAPSDDNDPEAEPPSTPRQRLERVLRAYASMPAAEREQRMEQARESHRAYRERIEERAAREQQAVESYRQEAAQLDALRAGELDEGVDADLLLVFDLNRLALPDTQAIRDARAEWAAALARFEALPREQRQQLLDAHRVRHRALPEELRAAEAAAREARERALEAARDADSLTERNRAEREVMLHDLRRAINEYRAERAQAGTRIEDLADDVDEDTPLADLDTRIKSTLRLLGLRLREGPHLPPEIGTVETEALDEDQRSRLAELRTERQSLVDVAEAEYPERLEALHGALATLNRLRVGRLDGPDADRRRSLRGFGQAALGRASDEVQMIQLELRYQLQTLPGYLRSWATRMRNEPFSTLLTVLQLLLIAFVARRWRKNADAFLALRERRFARLRPSTAFSRVAASLLGLLRHVREPLEWLLLVAVALWLFDPGPVPGLHYVITVVVYVNLALLAVRLLDGLAAMRQRRRFGGPADEHAALRYRSLRLVAGAVTGTLLALELTQTVVGRGTLYAWVLRLCWLLAIPLVIRLVTWWRPVVQARAAQRREPSSFFNWVANAKGVSAYFATAIGGVAMFGTGARREALRQVSRVGFLEQIVSYFFRRELEKRSAAGAGLVMLDEQIRRRLLRESPDLVSYMDQPMKELAGRLSGSSDSIAVVGERGTGKSTFVARAVAARDESGGRAISLRADHGGASALMLALRKELGVDADTPLEGDAFEGVDLVIIDDADQLITPKIGGLRDIDEVASVAHDTEGVTWLFVVSTPAWAFFRRARAGRASFDHVVTMERWSDAELQALLDERCASANIVPDFKALAPPDAVASDAEREAVARTDYVRLLNEYVEGNASLAIHFFGRSLAVSEDASFEEDEVVEAKVRVFRAPDTTALNDLPPSMYFVLRALVQLGQATEAEIAECTDLPTPEVADALRMCRAQKITNATQDGHATLRRHWFRAVVRLLQVQHLLGKST